MTLVPWVSAYGMCKVRPFGVRAALTPRIVTGDLSSLSASALTRCTREDSRTTTGWKRRKMGESISNDRHD